jgi:3-methyladenine DNA glycosylase/8-oxoguanine DNA glycosylase
MPTTELRRRLIALPGIGPYAAATLLGILGRHDFIPVDTEAMSVVSTHFYEGASVTAKEINAVFERFGQFKGLAYWFWDYAGMQTGPMEQWEAR